MKDHWGTIQFEQNMGISTFQEYISNVPKRRSTFEQDISQISKVNISYLLSEIEMELETDTTLIQLTE